MSLEACVLQKSVLSMCPPLEIVKAGGKANKIEKKIFFYIYVIYSI